ncbi:hypothetical protein AMTRI_Chr03g138860 [Amborella trichopoda]
MDAEEQNSPKTPSLRTTSSSSLPLELLALHHGKALIPQIPEIMSIVTNGLSLGSPSLRSSCSRVVSSLSRYTLNPTDPTQETEAILMGISSPLLDGLLGIENPNFAEGCADCLQRLVQSEAWSHAPVTVVNQVCLRVAGALQAVETRSISHMKLVCALAETNGFILEAYGSAILKSIAKILREARSTAEIFHALQVVNFLMRCIDVGVLESEVSACIHEIKRLEFGRDPSLISLVSDIFRVAKVLFPDVDFGFDYGFEGEFKGDEEWVFDERNVSVFDTLSEPGSPIFSGNALGHRPSIESVNKIMDIKEERLDGNLEELQKERSPLWTESTQRSHSSSASSSFHLETEPEKYMGDNKPEIMYFSGAFLASFAIIASMVAMNLFFDHRNIDGLIPT